MTAQIPDILLERYRLNELPPEERDRLTELLRHDATLKDRLDAIDRSNADLRHDGTLAALTDRLTDQTRATVRSPGARRSSVWWALPAAAAATIAIVVAARVQQTSITPPSTPSPDATQGDRIKGLRPSLAVYRRTANGSETLAEGAVARPGDLVRIAYHPAGRAYGVIFSIDGRGATTMHLPPNGARAAPLAREATALLDQAYELDDAPLWERFYFVTGDTPFEVTAILDTARRTTSRAGAAAPLSLPPGLDLSTFSLSKEARP